MPNTPSHKSIALNIVQSNENEAGKIELTRSSLGFDIDVDGPFISGNKSMSHDEARALRDALIKLYPIAAPAVTYTVELSGFTDDWCVMENAMAPATRVIARCQDEATAERIAATLAAQQETTTNA